MRFLIVEDEALIAGMIETAVLGLGHQVAAICSTVARAEAAVGAMQADCVVLDANLRGQSSTKLATLMRAMNIPVLVISGYEASELNGAFAEAAYLRKPFTITALTSELMQLAVIGRGSAVCRK